MVKWLEQRSSKAQLKNSKLYKPSSDMMATIAEPFFEMGARVEMQPVMNFEDLKKGLSAAIK